MQPKGLKWVGASVLAGLVLLALGALLVFRGYAVPLALACPGCAGFDRHPAGLLIESGASAGDLNGIRSDMIVARRRIMQSYGGLESSPVLIVCRSEACYRRMVGARLGGSRGIAFSAEVLVLSPRRMGATIAAHELSHIELHHRIGMAKYLSGAVPAWFDEGLAVLVADDRRYISPPGGDDRCLGPSIRPLPSTKLHWSHAAAHDKSIYADAACRVSRQLAISGQPNLRNLPAAILDGRTIEEITATNGT